jgi:hypothetical protein
MIYGDFKKNPVAKLLFDRIWFPGMGYVIVRIGVSGRGWLYDLAKWRSKIEIASEKRY